MKKNIVLVTGANGFIGSYICEELLNNDYSVIGIDNNSKYKFPYTEHHKHKNFIFDRLDLIYDADLLESIFIKNKPNIIIHCAAVIGGIHLFHQRQYDIIAENAKMDANILDLAIKHGVHRFVGLSSSMVYENTNNGRNSDNDHGDNLPRSKQAYRQV